MDIKRKTCDIQTWKKKKNISRHILRPTCPIALPVRWYSHHRSLLTVVSATSAPDRASSATFERPWENFSTMSWTALRDRHFPRKHFFMNILCMELFYSQRKHNGTLIFGSILLEHFRHVEYWNQPLNMRLPIYYLGSWKWTVLLSSDTRRNPITPITSVVLLFVTYLLHLPRNTHVTFTRCIHQAQPDTTFSIITQVAVVWNFVVMSDRLCTSKIIKCKV
jgi:hypothetical protein